MASKSTAIAFELITIGNELLTGKTLNTNSQWIAERITQIGGFLKRCLVVRDDVSEISYAVRDVIRRRSDFLIAVGGLGPTYDDKTLEGIALALRRRLVVNRRALQMIRRKYQEMVERGLLKKIEMTHARVKMATMPSRAKPLPNPVGTAPGVLLKANSMYIACLPGVPVEMKAIFEDSLIPLITKRVGKIFIHQKTLHLSKILESTLAPIIDQVLLKHPEVYVKSHPKGIEDGISRIEVDFMCRSWNQAEAIKKVERASDYLRKLVTLHEAVVVSD